MASSLLRRYLDSDGFERMQTDRNNEDMITKEKAIAEYHRVKQKLQHKPSQTEYLNLSQITRYDLKVLYGVNAYSKLVKDAGDQPEIFYKPARSKEELLTVWGKFTRKLGNIQKGRLASL